MNTMTISNPDANNWNPIRGNCFNAVEAPTPQVKEEAVGVLSRCVNPALPDGKKTGLVIGYVQSGKTSSFTSVAALARDNGYQIVIVVSGSSVALYKQSADRVESVLGKAEPNGWVPIRSGDIKRQNKDHHIQMIRQGLDFWRAEGGHQSLKKTVLLCTMKNASHLDMVLEVLREVNLEGVKALIIDDEADQASMNFAKIPGQETGIYSRLNGLRQLLPHVTYLQYTATPQAPLLVRVDDVLSPEFCKVLSPGNFYSGPHKFFDQDATRLTREIAQSDMAAAQRGEAPKALHRAMAFFFLGVAAHFQNPLESGERNRTMMVHPSQQTVGHEDYEAFVNQTIQDWRAALSGSDRAAVQRTFQEAFEDLRQGVDGVSFDELWSRVAQVLGLTTVVKMNATATGTRQVNWHNPYHILIGGAMLDRGFTVEGLTVTYMPRELGGGAADSIQQRARWFGYKEKYIGYCRVWLQGTSINAYRRILDHEESIRESLRSHVGTLRDWKRRFFLEAGLKPTRDQVVRLNMVSGRYGGNWFEQKAPKGIGDDSPTDNNREFLEELFEGESFGAYGRPDWTARQRSEIARDVPIAKVREFLLSFTTEDPSDTPKLIGLTMQVAAYAEKNPNTTCAVVKMGFTNGVWTELSRAKTDRLHQGRTNVSATNPNAYPGDKEIHEGCLTVQVFKMENDVPAIAVYVPTEMGKQWRVEHR
jgi:hypothetical protein